jgi:hypothetical protein
VEIKGRQSPVRQKFFSMPASASVQTSQAQSSVDVTALRHGLLTDLRELRSQGEDLQSHIAEIETSRRKLPSLPSNGARRTRPRPAAQTKLLEELSRVKAELLESKQKQTDKDVLLARYRAGGSNHENQIPAEIEILLKTRAKELATQLGQVESENAVAINDANVIQELRKEIAKSEEDLEALKWERDEARDASRPKVGLFLFLCLPQIEPQESLGEIILPTDDKRSSAVTWVMCPSCLSFVICNAPRACRWWATSCTI